MATNGAAGMEEHLGIPVVSKIVSFMNSGPGLPVDICLKLYSHSLMKILNIWLQKAD